jgi:hypothetical protein
MGKFACDQVDKLAEIFPLSYKLWKRAKQNSGKKPARRQTAQVL